VAQHPKSFPPVVINITDGESTDGDPYPASAAIRELETEDGNVLLLNLHLSSCRAPQVFFPDSESGLAEQENMPHCCSTCRAICLLLCGAQRAIWGIRSLIQRVDLCSMQKFRTQFNFWTSAREQQICGRNHARFGSSFLVAQSRS